MEEEKQKESEKKKEAKLLEIQQRLGTIEELEKVEENQTVVVRVESEKTEENDNSIKEKIEALTLAIKCKIVEIQTVKERKLVLHHAVDDGNYPSNLLGPLLLQGVNIDYSNDLVNNKTPLLYCLDYIVSLDNDFIETDNSLELWS